MSLAKAYVDGFLIDWEDGEYEAQVQMLRARSKSAMTVAGRRSVSVGGSGGKGRGGGDQVHRAQAIRERLDRTIRKVPEVMVKITSSCKGLTEIGRHISYISRKGQIALEDQDGCILSGKDQLTDLREEWRYGGVRPLGEVSDRRDTLNLVFSMPALTDEAGLKRAVRAFAQSEFAGHQYVFAYHTPSTDPDPDPPDHAHIHLCLRMERPDGKHLNPRKADLQRWREGFAAELRAHGIEANATTRLARLKRTRGSARAIKAMEAEGRGQADIRSPESVSPRVEKAQRLEQRRLEYYYAASRILAESEEPADRHLAVRLAQHIQTLASPDRVNQRLRRHTTGLSPNAERPNEGWIRVVIPGFTCLSQGGPLSHQSGRLGMIMQIREVTLQALRSAIGQSVAGDYCARYSTDVDPDVWTRSAQELEAFASEKGFRVQSHPWMDKGRPQLDVLMVSIR